MRGPSDRASKSLIVEMISFIENEFGVQAMEDEISEANFGSLTGIARYIGDKRGVLAS